MNNPVIQLSFERTQIPNTFLEQMNVSKLSVYPLINGFITYEVLFLIFTAAFSTILFVKINISMG